MTYVMESLNRSKPKLVQLGYSSIGNLARQLVSSLLDVRLEAEIAYGDKLFFHVRVLNKIDKAIAQICAGAPISYCVGSTYFMKLRFWINRDVLDPREDTESWVRHCIEELKHSNINTIWDVGCGSGCIGISLAYYIKPDKVVLSDISQRALSVARYNSQQHLMNIGVSVLHSAFLDLHPPGLPDLIVANMPYVGLQDVIHTNIVHEPATALYSLDNGNWHNKQLMDQVIQRYIKAPRSMEIWMEMADWQIETMDRYVQKICLDYNVVPQICVIMDDYGNRRVLRIMIHKSGV